MAKSLAAEGAPHGTVVVADSQAQGRGRMGRGWFSVPGKSLMLSVILRWPYVEPDPSVTLVAALSGALAIKAVTHLDTGLKWPNDVYMNGRKVCGVLGESINLSSDHKSSDRKEKEPVIILGVGVNVNISAEEFPEDLRPKATSLLLESGVVISRRILCKTLLSELGRNLRIFRKGGFALLKKDFEALSIILGEEIELQVGDSRWTGRVMGLTDEGALKLELQSGEIKVFHSGEATIGKMPSKVICYNR